MQERPLSNHLSEDQVHPELRRKLTDQWTASRQDRLVAAQAPIDVEHANWQEHEGHMLTLEFEGVRLTGLLLKRDEAFRLAGATVVITGNPISGHGQPLDQYMICSYCLEPMQRITIPEVTPAVWRCQQPDCTHVGVQYSSE